MPIYTCFFSGVENTSQDNTFILPHSSPRAVFREALLYWYVFGATPKLFRVWWKHDFVPFYVEYIKVSIFHNQLLCFFFNYLLLSKVSFET